MQNILSTNNIDHQKQNARAEALAFSENPKPTADSAWVSTNRALLHYL
jgi:hypothetical protein